MMCKFTYEKFKTSVKPWISLEKVHRIIKFNCKTRLKPYIGKIFEAD